MGMKQQSKRATFLDVGDAQDEIREIIDACISKNKVLTEEEKNKFIRLLRLSTLGLGKDFKFIFSTDIGRFDLGHVHHAACWLAYQTDTNIRIEGHIFEIKEVWYQLRDYLFTVFPFADTMSVQISKEQNIYGGNAEATGYDELG
jgi:hypothetical protein